MVGPDVAALSVRAVSKTFPGTKALDQVDLDLRAGRVTALVGHNGSGKSTLVKILAGLYKPDEDGGTIAAPGDRGWHESIHFIHQDLGLVADLSTIENLDLSRPIGWNGLSPNRPRNEARVARRLIAEFGISFDVNTPIRNLSPAQRTIVAIARALSRWPDNYQVLVLDEPTAALQDREAEILLEVITRIAGNGAAVLFISHRLAEVEKLADDVVVLRDGQVIAHLDRGEFTSSSLVELIAGTDGEASTLTHAETGHAPWLTITGLEGSRLHGVDLEVRKGEVLGVSGVIGSGIEELLGTLFGSIPRAGGDIRLDGEQVEISSPAEAIALGLGFVPRDRHRHGAILAFSAKENLTLPRLSPFRRLLGSIHLGKERKEAHTWFSEAKVRPGTPERTFAQFSGGNQQKIVLAKWMRNVPSVLLLEEPTQGVDVGAQASIYEMVHRAATSGAAVLVASSDTKELVGLCHRVIVLTDGVVSAELTGTALTESNLVRHTLSSRTTTKEN
jgi:ribose transport system ATP-binding protein